MRRKLELCKGNTKQLIVTAMDSMQAEIDRIQNEHNETLKRLFESHNAQISETKKKQWVSPLTVHYFFRFTYVLVFSASIVSRTRFIIAAGTRRTVRRHANNSIGRPSISKFAGARINVREIPIQSRCKIQLKSQ